MANACSKRLPLALRHNSLSHYFCCSIAAVLINSPAHARSLAEVKQSSEIRFCVRVYGPVIGTVKPSDCLGEHCQFSWASTLAYRCIQ